MPKTLVSAARLWKQLLGWALRQHSFAQASSSRLLASSTSSIANSTSSISRGVEVEFKGSQGVRS